ncbi:MAG: hypothetical protein NTZ26_08220 [Candidatus Aminicenantes bacterium]|nr:hypothetical protein [Candidatus Aminicenantes bacterium]
MDIKLSRAQYETLMRLVYLGNWMVNGFRDKDKDSDTDALENYIYAKARDFGLGDRITYDEEADAHFPTETQESEWLADLDDGKNDLFWDELMYRLADRDLVARFGEANVDAMSAEERKRMEDELADLYYKEFEKNGLDKLQLIRPS